MAETKASLALSCAVLMLSLHRMAVSTSPKLQVVTSGPSHYSRAWPPAAALYLRGGSSLAAANETSPLARCGSATADADTSHLPPDPKAWELAHVLEFLQQLHPTLKDRTDQYKQLFIDNDIDGVILLGLTTDKLEKMGMKSLGHREHLIAAIQDLRAAKGMQRGPKPADFEAAMAAQQAPPKNPPRKIAEGIQDPSHDEKPLKWTSVQRTAWDQQGRDVDVYIFLEGVGDVDKDNIKVGISELSVDVRIKNLNGSNFVYHMPRLYDKIIPSDSFWKVRPNKIHLKLYKSSDEAWARLERKEDGDVIDKFLDYSAKSWDSAMSQRDKQYAREDKRDPGEGLLSLIKDMYKDGDADTKRAIAQAWSKASERSAAHGGSPNDMM